MLRLQFAQSFADGRPAHAERLANFILRKMSAGRILSRQDFPLQTIGQLVRQTRCHDYFAVCFHGPTQERNNSTRRAPQLESRPLRSCGLGINVREENLERNHFRGIPCKWLITASPRSLSARGVKGVTLVSYPPSGKAASVGR